MESHLSPFMSCMVFLKDPSWDLFYFLIYIDDVTTCNLTVGSKLSLSMQVICCCISLLQLIGTMLTCNQILTA